MKLEINHKKEQPMGQVNNQWATKQSMGQLRNQRENQKKYTETNENENTMIQNLWDTSL